VIALEVVEHLFYPKKLFEQSYQLLRTGGYLILSTPYHGYLKNLAIFNLRGTAAFRRQGDRSSLTRAQRPSEAQSNRLCDPSMGEQNLLSKAASFRGQWLTSLVNGWDQHFRVDWDGGHIKFFSKKTLAQMACEAGFKSPRFYGIGRVPALWKSMIMVAEK
jgi:hypothetical protein